MQRVEALELHLQSDLVALQREVENRLVNSRVHFEQILSQRLQEQISTLRLDVLALPELTRHHGHIEENLYELRGCVDKTKGDLAGLRGYVDDRLQELRMIENDKSVTQEPEPSPSL